ncbi:MAG: hypothetical protein KDD40_11315, partial [Bdellovibrionales bacterium]|nr:hypothetical protein [Bdellovibrionales bacterium]
NTHVFFVGLNGFSEEVRPDEPAFVNLYSEIVQTPFFIKPAQKLRDQGIVWKIDRNISLVDVGATLYDLFHYSPDSPKNRDLEVSSLKSVLDKPEVVWNTNRFILIETAFPQWRASGGSRFSVRSGYYSMIYDKKIKLYNTLIDRSELSPIPHKDKLWRSIFSPMHKYMMNNGLNQWEGLNSNLLERVNIAKKIWNQQNKDFADLFNDLNLTLAKFKKDSELMGWKAQVALENQQWKKLLSAAKSAKNKYWLYLAKKKLGQPIKIPARDCIQFFTKIAKDYNNLKECNDDLFSSLMLWRIQDKGLRKELFFDKFIREYYNFLLEKKLRLKNMQNGLIWDVALEESFGPSITEIYLNLTKNKKLKERVDKRILKLQ